jgi:hypothetical protein
MFYHDKKEHMSPSAFDQWHRQRSAFVGSYFEEKERVQTKAMEAGTQIHRLIEAGLIPAKCVYDVAEEVLKVKVPGTEFYFLGVPDSRVAPKPGAVVKFVDYKSGKANDWKDKLPTDLKMKATAWLVWMASGGAEEGPEEIYGAIEFIQTTWDPENRQVVALEGKETEVIEITYTAEELKAFTQVIAETMHEVNKVYEKWLEQTDAFVNKADIEKYEALNVKAEALKAEMDDLKDRIKDQMQFGGLLNYKSEAGTFYLTEKSTYSYPPNLKVNYLDMGLVLEDVEAIEGATKTAKKNYELMNDPVSVSQSIGFRAKKEKVLK